MTIKRYLAKDMNEAMTLIRYELGRDAVIISSRWIRKKGIKNLFKKKVLEVTAAAQAPSGYPSSAGSRSRELEKEVRELKEMVSLLMEEKKKSSAGEERFSSMIKQHFERMDLDDDIMKDFFRFCRKPENQPLTLQRIGGYFKNRLKGSLADIEKTGERVWAFIGPTGVGKTTTIAKLAALEALKNRKKVGLVTTDTFRIGAVEQLKTYADILHIPLEVVTTEEEMAKAMKRLKDCDRILIDSTGRNSRAKEQLQETKNLLRPIPDRSNILVVSAATRRMDLELILKNYKEIGYDYVLLTKLDETQCYGSILNISYYSGKPLCYLTTGQIVPEDIKNASMENLLEYLFMGVDA
jgi:flagellar biosynthesis protein FlhF